MKSLVKLSGILAVAIFAAVQAQAAVVLNETFSYVDGDLPTVSGGLWVNHSGNTGSLDVQVLSGQAEIAGAGARTGDDNRMLSGNPYSTGTVLYASFDVTFTLAPSATTTYFAHFKDNSTFGFFGRVFGTNDNGMIQMGIGNSSGGVANGLSGYVSGTFALNTTQKIVVRLDMTTGDALSTIWLNPTLESDPSGTASDAANVAVGYGIESYALRQSAGQGAILLDNLLVGTTFADVIPEPSSLALVAIGVAGLFAIRRRRS